MFFRTAVLVLKNLGEKFLWIDRLCLVEDGPYKNKLIAFSLGNFIFDQDFLSTFGSAMLRTSETIPIQKGKLALGTWQALYLIEHRARAHRREVVVQFIGRTRPEKPA